MSVTVDRPIAQVLSDIAGNVQHIVRAEMRLAKAELRQDVALVKRGALFIAVGAVTGILGLTFLCLAAVYALASTMPAWAAALIVAIVVSIIAAFFLLTARRQISGLGLPRTSATVQENVQWVKTHVE
jgi:uncharacterized membrane protein YqjE